MMTKSQFRDLFAKERFKLGEWNGADPYLDFRGFTVLDPIGIERGISVDSLGTVRIEWTSYRLTGYAR